MRLRLGLVLILTLFLVSCGDDGSNAAIAKLTITPATASISINSTIMLRGDTVGFGNDPLMGWYMQEGTGDSSAPYCGLDAAASPPSWTICPCGYVAFDTKATGASSAVAYHAPPNAGTCHVVFNVSARNGFVIGLTQTASAEIAVTQ